MINQNSNPAVGYISMLLCCLTGAISFVFIAHLNKTHNQMLSIFITFGYAAILFNLFNIKNITNLYSSATKKLKLIFNMNLMTLINWVSSFLSLNYIDPATAICINLCVLSITIFFVLTPLKKIRENKHLVFSIILILISMALIIKQRIDISHTDISMIMLGVAFSVAGGISGAFIGLHSEGMGKAGFSITQILATRFYLLIAVSGIAFFFFSESVVPISIDWKYYLLSSLVIVIFPLIMYQTAIKTLGALIVSLLEPFTPVITYLLQVGIGDYRFNSFTIILLVMSSSAVIWFVKIEQNIARARKIAERESMLGVTG